MATNINSKSALSANGISYYLDEVNSSSYSAHWHYGWAQMFKWGSARGWIKIPLPDEYNEVFIEYGAFNGGVNLWIGDRFIGYGTGGLLYHGEYSSGEYIRMDESNMMDIKAVWVRRRE